MRSLIAAVALLIGLIPTWSQSSPDVELAPGSPPVLGSLNDSMTMRGTIIAYDWSTRHYMEGARVEKFIFQSEDDNSKFVRVVLVWHPADNKKIVPQEFYAPGKVWNLTLRTTSPYDFVRQYCTMNDTPTFPANIGNGKKAELPRYVKPTVLPPDNSLTTNFKTAIAKRPISPEMPDTTSMQCTYLEKVRPAEHQTH